MSKTINDRLLLVVIALVIVVAAKLILDPYGGFTALMDRGIKSGMVNTLERVCETEPNNPECQAALNTLEKSTNTANPPQPSPTLSSEIIDLRSPSPRPEQR